MSLLLSYCVQGVTITYLCIYCFTEQAIVRHVSLSLNVDFENKVLSGTAVTSFDVLEDIEEVVRIFIVFFPDSGF